MSERLRNFVAELLAQSGAVLEPIEPNGLEVLSPPEVQEALSVPELARLGFSPELPEAAERVGLESDWLDRLHGLLGKRGQWAHLSWRADTKTNAPPNPDRILERTLVLENAIFRLQNVAPARTRYLVLFFRFSALSDEKREGILRIGFNLSNGAILDGFLDELLTDLFSPGHETGWHDGGSADSEEELPDIWEKQKLHTILQHTLPPRINNQLDPFLQGLYRRQDRGLERLHGYFSDMRREIQERILKSQRSLRGEKLGEDLKRHRLRLESIAGEYKAKVVDLRQKYAMTVHVEFIQGLVLVMPVSRFSLLIKRRKGERPFHLDWNPVARKLEAPPCEYSFTGVGSRMVCDDALHLVNLDAHCGCPKCGKPFCWACHTEKCPKCNKKHSSL